MDRLGIGLILRLLALFVAPLLFATGCLSVPHAQVYVSPNGNDSWSGRLAATNANGTDGPVATLEGARNAVRGLKKSGHAKGNAIHVAIRGGEYRLSRTVVFGPDDSGNSEQPIIYEAYPGERPVFSSSVSIHNWKKYKASDFSQSAQTPGIEPRIPDAAKGHVWVADIPEGLGGFKVLYDGNQMLHRARSKGFMPEKRPNPDLSITTLHYEGAQIRNWTNLQDIELIVRPTHLWTMNILPLAAVDETSRMALTAIPSTYPLEPLVAWGGKPVDSVWVENVLDYLDEPGEWAVDTTKGRIYYWPADDKPGDKIAAPCLKELIRLEGNETAGQPVHHIEFKGLTFTQGERDTWTISDAGLQHDWDMFDKGNALVRLRTTENCAVTQCRFFNSGGDGVRLDLRSMNNRVETNEFNGLGGTGIIVCGYGPGTTDLSKHNEISNNHVHDCGRLYWHSAGIHVWQSGDNRVANNLVHNMPYSGIVVSGIGTMYMDHLGVRELMRTVRWNETGEGTFTLKRLQPFLHSRNNVIERNEIYDVMKVMGDGNGIYVRFCSETGNVIRNNYVHDITARYSAGGIRCDGEQSGFLVTENIVRNCTFAAFSSDGANEVTNNIFMDVFEQDPSEAAGTGPSATGGPYSPFYRGYIWHPGTGFRGSKIERNIFYHTGSSPVEFYDPPFTDASQLEDLRLTQMDRNIYFHSRNPKVRHTPLQLPPQAGGEQEQLDKIKMRGSELNSLAADPLFVDADKGDFRFQNSSPAPRIGIREINIDWESGFSSLRLANQEICAPGKEAPSWHADMLQAREKRLHDGSSHLTDWNEARKTIRDRTK